MTLNNSKQDIIDNRRRLVMSLRLRGATQREIITQLAADGHVNHETGQPWSLGVINKDLQAITAEWREERMKTMDEHVARQLAELFEVKRSAWSQKELDTVLRALKQETDLLGTNAPSRQEHTGAGGAPIIIKEIRINEPLENSE
jgi:hypothetical protein